jgi:hypothetical protein
MPEAQEAFHYPFLPPVSLLPKLLQQQMFHKHFTQTLPYAQIQIQDVQHIHCNHHFQG